MSGAAGKVDQLEMDRRELKKKEAELKAQLKKAKQVEERAERAWQLGGFLVRVVLIVFSLCNYDTPAAVQYLEMAGRKRRWPERPKAELQELVENLFLECGTEEFTDLANTSSPKDPKAFREAVRYSEEW